VSNTLEYSNEGIRRDFARRGIAIVTVHDTMLKCCVASELNVGNHKDGPEGRKRAKSKVVKFGRPPS